MINKIRCNADFDLKWHDKCKVNKIRCNADFDLKPVISLREEKGLVKHQPPDWRDNVSQAGMEMRLGDILEKAAHSAFHR